MKKAFFLNVCFLATVFVHADDLCIPQNGLQVWFRADRAINTQPNDPALTYGGMVTNWSSCLGNTALMTASTNATLIPIYNPNSVLRTDGSFGPAVRFSRDINNTATSASFLQSTTQTGFSITRSNTWFIVCKPLVNLNQTGLFGSPNSTRFGAFYIGTPSNNALRVHNGNSVNSLQMIVPINRTSIIDSRRTESNIEATLNGLLQCSATGQTLTINSDYFRIGFMLDGVTGKFIGDIAEVIIYNRSVSDTERLIIQNSLAARNAVELDPSCNYYAASTGTSNGCFYGVTGIGRYTASLNPNGTPLMQSENSDGLQLTALNGSLDYSGEFLMCGYRGRISQWQAKRLTREWFVKKTSTNGLEARFLFSTATPSNTTARLYFKSNIHDDYVALPLTATVTETTTSFDLMDTVLQSGFYTLGYDDDRIPDNAPFMANGLSTLFRADSNVQTSNGFVTAWSSCWGPELQTKPTEVTNCPSLITSAFTVTPNDTEPAVRFNYNGDILLTNRTHLLWSTEKTTLGVTGSNATIFVVGRHMVVDQDIGIFGFDNTINRMGLFFTSFSSGVTSQLQYWPYLNSGSLYKPTAYVRKDATFIVDCSCKVSGLNQRCIAGYNQGQVAGLYSVSNIYAPAMPLTERLLIGTHLRNGFQRNFAGDLAEIRIYNRTLNDAERAILQYHLAARYGALLTYDHFNGRDPRYFRSLVGIGCTREESDGRTPGNVNESEWSGGLKLVALNGTLSSDSEYLLAAYASSTNDWTANHWRRDWFISPINTDGMDVQFTFDFTRASIVTNAQRNFVLLYKSSSTNEFSVVPGSTFTDRGSQIDFTLPSVSVREGYYTLGLGTAVQAVTNVLSRPVAGVPGGLQAWYRADYLNTDSSGYVTNWINLGLLGSSLNATNVSSGTKPQLRPGSLGIYGPTVRITGGQYLQSCQQTDLGIARETTWFVVYKAEKTDTPVFGLTSDPPRFGAFHIGTAPYPLRAHAFCDNNSAQYCMDNDITTNLYQLVDYRRAIFTGTNYTLSLHCNGTMQVSKSAYQTEAVTAYLGLGKMMATYNTMYGELAEVRIYNRALNDLERIIVQQNMLWRYGLATNSIYFTDAGATTPTYILDLVGVGRSTNVLSSANIPGSLYTSESSGGLTVDVSPAQLTPGEATLLAAHQATGNSWTRPSATLRRAMREWAIHKNASVPFGATLSFSLSQAGLAFIDSSDYPIYKLLYRASPAEASVLLELTPAITGDTLTFTLDDTTLQSGLYTLGATVTPKGTILFVR